jgi:hypothetical protein
MGMRFYASKTNKNKKLSILYHPKSSLSKANSTLTTKNTKHKNRKFGIKLNLYLKLRGWRVPSELAILHLSNPSQLGPSLAISLINKIQKQRKEFLFF